jgi:hypothetical protein
MILGDLTKFIAMSQIATNADLDMAMNADLDMILPSWMWGGEMHHGLPEHRGHQSRRR